MLAILFFVPAMNLAGIPPLSGFVGKIGLLQAGAEEGGVLAYLLIGGRGADQSADAVRDGQGLEPCVLGGRSPTLPSRRGSLGSMPKPMLATAAVLVLVGAAITVVAGPLYGFAERSAADLVGGQAYVTAVLPEDLR